MHSPAKDDLSSHPPLPGWARFAPKKLLLKPRPNEQRWTTPVKKSRCQRCGRAIGTSAPAARTAAELPEHFRPRAADVPLPCYKTNWPAAEIPGMQAMPLIYLLNYLGIAHLGGGIVFLWFELTQRHY